MANLLVFGAGYSGTAIARAALRSGYGVVVTSRQAGAPAIGPARIVGFEDAAGEIARATHIVATAPPGEAGDPILARHGVAIAAAPLLAWCGYLSTTGVYGDRQGGWVDEATPPAPLSRRAERRVAAEQAWRDVAGTRALDLCRLAGIYGPGRSALDEMRSGRARRVIRPGHAFGRIHRDDIAGGVVAAMQTAVEGGARVLNFSDDLPAESAAVIAEAARLLGLPSPLEVSFEAAWAGMSEMGRSFWTENRRVASAETQRVLRRAWRYPSYREGLRAILDEELQGDVAEQPNVLRPG